MNVNKTTADLVLSRLREYVKTDHFRYNHFGDSLSKKGREFNLGFFISWMHMNGKLPADLEPSALVDSITAYITTKMSQLFYELEPIIVPLLPVNCSSKQRVPYRWWLIRNKTG